MTIKHRNQRERESKTKSNVMIMAKSTVLEDIKIGKTDRQCGYFKTKVLEDHKAEAIDNTINQEQIIVFINQSTG